jgi:hypothetical protein
MAVVTLIVMEPGSEWPGYVEDSESVVAVAHGDEGLLARTRRRLDAMRQERQQDLRVAVLACNTASDVTSVARRTEIAHELLTAVTEVGSGKLVLAASDRITMQQRCELLSLAGELSQRLRGGTATVSVRFGETSRREIGLADGIGGEVLSLALRRYGAEARPSGL